MRCRDWIARDVRWLLRTVRPVVLPGIFVVGGCLNAPPAGEVPTQAPVVFKREKNPILSPATPPGDLYTVGEVRAFEMRQGDRVIGRSWGRYQGPDADGNHRFETRIELEVPGRRQARSEGILTLDPRGRLVEGVERSDAAQLLYRRELDELVLTAGKREDRVAYAPETEPVAVMAHSAIFHQELMFGLAQIRDGENAWRLVSLSGGAPTAWEGDASATSEGVEIRTNLGEVVTLVEGRLERVEVEAADLTITSVSLEAAAWPAWTITGPRVLTYSVPADAKFAIRQVELPGRVGEPQLAGEVLVPTEDETPKPGVLFISGSGQEDRHGFAGPPAVDLGSHEITDALGNAGFVVLRFDERGQGASEEGEVSFLGQVEDARRGLRTLMVQPEVDPSRIIVVGHGEGGWRALHLAAERPAEVKGVALLASPGRLYKDVFEEQARAQLEKVPPQVRKQAQRQQRQMMLNLEQGGAVPPELAGQAKWIREMFAQRPADLIGRTSAKLWIAQGSKDFEVDPQRDTAALVAAAKRHRKRYRVRRYPGLDHLFKPEPGVSAPERYLEPGRAVDTAFIRDLVDWTRTTAQ